MCCAAVLLVQAVQKWKDASDGNLPSTSKERSAFKESLNRMRRRSADGVPHDVSTAGRVRSRAGHTYAASHIMQELLRQSWCSACAW